MAQNVRTDGRGRFEFRPYHLETGLITQTNGSSKYVALIQGHKLSFRTIDTNFSSLHLRFVIDKTHVVVGVKAELAEPLSTAPDCGIIKVSVDWYETPNSIAWQFHSSTYSDMPFFAKI